MDLNTQPNEKLDLIWGTWYVDPSTNSKGDLLLQKEPFAPMPPAMAAACGFKGWGHRIEFRENGDLVDAYSAWCGIDSAIHQWSGKWIWSEEERGLLLQIE